MTFLSSLFEAVILLRESENTVSIYGKCHATKEDVLETHVSQQLQHREHRRAGLLAPTSDSAKMLLNHSL